MKQLILFFLSIAPFVPYAFPHGDDRYSSIIDLVPHQLPIWQTPPVLLPEDRDRARRHIMGVVHSELGLFPATPKQWQQALYALKGSQIDTRPKVIRRIMGLFGPENSYIYYVIGAFPELNLKPWVFPKVPTGFWHDPHNVRAFVENVLEAEKALPDTRYPPTHWKHYLPFYKLKKGHFERHGGASLIAAHRSCPHTLLLAVFPQAVLLPWKWESVPDGTWDDDMNVKAFIQFVLDEEKLAPDTEFPSTHWRHYAPYYALTSET